MYYKRAANTIVKHQSQKIQNHLEKKTFKIFQVRSFIFAFNFI